MKEKTQEVICNDAEAQAVFLTEWIGVILLYSRASYERAASWAEEMYYIHEGNFQEFKDRFIRWENGEALPDMERRER